MGIVLHLNGMSFSHFNGLYFVNDRSIFYQLIVEQMLCTWR